VSIILIGLINVGKAFINTFICLSKADNASRSRHKSALNGSTAACI